MSTGDTQTPVLDTIADMTAASVERCEFSADVLLLVRLAALASVGAPRISYLAHIRPSAEAGLSLEDMQNVLIAVAPIIGSARTMAAAIAITEALGVAIAVVEAEESAEAGPA